MYLKDLIARLEREDPNRVIKLGFNTPNSYRGYYDDLAFSPKANVRIGDMLECAQISLHRNFAGYKGGTYRMDEFSECWLAVWGQCGETIGPVLLEFMLGDGIIDVEEIMERFNQ